MMRTDRLPRLLTVGISAVGLTTVAAASGPAAAAERLLDGIVTVGHRGAAGIAPENTLAAIAAGAAAGPDFVEVDVRLTADGVPVLLHDATLSRTTDVETVFPDRATAALSAFTYDEVRRLDAGSWFRKEFRGQRVPTFDQILDVLPDGVGVYIEIKDPASSPGLSQVIVDELAGDPRWGRLADEGRLLTLSFDHTALREFHDLRPDIPVMALGPVPADDAALADVATWADAWGTNYRTVNPADIDRVQAAGMFFSVYTVNGPVPVDELIGLGVDAITSDFPAMVHNVEAGLPPVSDANGIVVTEINADVPGDDVQPENGEHVVLTNTSRRPIPVGGYVIHDGARNMLRIGNGYILWPGDELRVYTADGTNTRDRYYNGGDRAVLNNDGESVAVFTRHGTLVDLAST